MLTRMGAINCLTSSSRRNRRDRSPSSATARSPTFARARAASCTILHWRGTPPKLRRAPTFAIPHGPDGFTHHRNGRVAKETSQQRIENIRQFGKQAGEFEPSAFPFFATLPRHPNQNLAGGLDILGLPRASQDTPQLRSAPKNQRSHPLLRAESAGRRAHDKRGIASLPCGPRIRILEQLSIDGPDRFIPNAERIEIAF